MLIYLVVSICLYFFASYVSDYFSYEYCNLFYDNLIECNSKHCKHYNECKKNLNKKVRNNNE